MPCSVPCENPEPGLTCLLSCREFRRPRPSTTSQWSGTTWPFSPCPHLRTGGRIRLIPSLATELGKPKNEEPCFAKCHSGTSSYRECVKSTMRFPSAKESALLFTE